MLLVFDIGNTNTVVGVFDKEELLCELRLKTDTGRTIDEYRVILFQLLKEKLGSNLKFSICVLSSVVPALSPIFMQLIKEGFNITPIVIGPGVKTGMHIRLSEPTTVGADRVVNAVAAKALFGYPVIVVDFGTATSFDVVGIDGHYEGGIIAPGIQVALEGLVRRTAQLPSIELSWPKNIIGKTTVQAMQSGVLVGYVCMVDGLIAKLKQELKNCKTVIATGGLGGLIASHSNEIKTYEKNLTLIGLKIIAEMNA
jgi:type III pantothenate kinase